MAVLKYLDISTVHVAKDVLNPDPSPVCLIADYEYGAFYYVPTDLDDLAGVAPDSLIDVLKYAKRQGCVIVRLDCDAEPVKGLPTYNW